MNGYEWDGARWVQQPTRPDQGWAPPAAGMPPNGGPFPPLAPSGFTEARYGYGLTRRASDDIAFIARYMKIVIIIGLVLLGLLLFTQFVAFLTVLGLVGGTLPHR